MSRLFAVLGAVFYFAWGALHLLAAANSFRFADSMEPGLVQGRLFQGAIYVALFAIVAIVVALMLNWKNSRTGYWVNLLAVSAADIPFVLFIGNPWTHERTRSLARPIALGRRACDIDARSSGA